MNKIVNGVLVPLRQEEITQRELDVIEFQKEQTATLEVDRVANIWNLIDEQEELSIRAVLENDTAWIETRKANIAKLKGEL